ncbi:MAG: hypothetical protein QM221_05750, partial [Bacillota bacterium]|nr:hypothetical protein [Bacillota bacterium]
MEQTINGNIRIADNDYSYFYDKYTEKITINFENKLVSVPENIDIFVGKKHGVQLGGKTLFKLIFPLSNDIMCVESNSPKYISTPSQVRAVDYYIEDYEEKSQYSEIRLQFPELNYFIPSNGLAEVTDEEVVISRKEKEHFSFDFKYQNKEVHISFISKMKSNHGVKVTTDTFSEVRIKFPETNDFEFI